MEHRLIQGGEQYLPFARSRVRALLALGLPYANQSFEIDGVSIKVRVEPGHEYIRIEGGTTAYMESGQLSWSGIAEMDPMRYDAAKWHFLDIPTTDKYLGLVVSSPPKSQGKQKNSPDLAENMSSIAIGYPQVLATEDTTQEQADATNAETKNKYSDITLLKKIMAGFFPASMFSGKMRLFMQAQYGGREKIQPYGLEIDLVGSSAVLKYRGRTGIAVQFGIYSHISPGIFTAPDGSYWLIHITNPTTLLYNVVAYPIKVGRGAQPMRAKLKDPATSDEERIKIEAYLFAEAEIDTSSPTILGSFSGRNESAIGYGWKWNKDGSAASIVVHESQGTNDHDNVWIARTIHLAVTYVKSDTDFVFRADAHVLLHGPWTDGWGAFNIFTTSDDPPAGGPLEHWSLATNRLGVMPAFEFAVSVYGYYINDVWTPVNISRKLSSDPIYTQEDTGIRYAPGTDLTTPNRYKYGVLPANSGCYYRSERVIQNTEMPISFGSFSYDGTQRFGDFTVYTKQILGTGSTTNTVGFATASLSGAFIPYTPAGYKETSDYVSTCRTLRTVTTWTGYAFHAWALIIPTDDCEAVYISTHAYDASDLVTEVAYEDGGISSFDSFVPWAGSGDVNGWYGIALDQTITTTHPPAQSSTTYVFNFNTAVHGVAGTPGGSYYTLFNVAYDYPYYDRGMYTFTSYGNRYVMSEGPAVPPSVNRNHRFVGWA